MKRDPAKFRQCLIDKLENGEWPFSVPIGYKKGPYRVIERQFNDQDFGYRIKPVIVRDMVLDPNRSGFISKVFDLYATNQYSLEALRRQLKLEYAFLISCTYLHVILTNRLYKGEMVFEGQVYKCDYPRLVDAETFEKCQQNLKNRASRKGTIKEKGKFVKKLASTDELIYRKFITCLLCPNTKLSCERQRGIAYYRCASKKRRYNEGVDLHSRGYIREEVINSVILEGFKSINVSGKFLNKVSSALGTNLRFFLDNYVNWFVLNDRFKRSISNFLFSEITYNGSIFKITKRSPFDGRDYQGFKSEDLNNIIIELGYKPLIEEIVTEKVETAKSVPPSDDFELSKKILKLCVKPISHDNLIEKLGISLTELQDILFELQIDGRIEQDDLGYWRVK